MQNVQSTNGRSIKALLRSQLGGTWKLGTPGLNSRRESTRPRRVQATDIYAQLEANLTFVSASRGLPSDGQVSTVTTALTSTFPCLECSISRASIPGHDFHRLGGLGRREILIHFSRLGLGLACATDGPCLLESGLKSSTLAWLSFWPTR